MYHRFPKKYVNFSIRVWNIFLPFTYVEGFLTVSRKNCFYLEPKVSTRMNTQSVYP